MVTSKIRLRWHNNLLVKADLSVLHINKITLGHITHRNHNNNYSIVTDISCLLRTIVIMIISPGADSEN